MLRVARFGKQFGCGHTPKFLQGAGPAKMLVGELPKPAGLLDTLSRSPWLSAARSYRSWALFSRPSGMAEQMINVRFYCHGLPHLPLGIPVFCIKLFLLSRQLTAGCSSAS